MPEDGDPAGTCWWMSGPRDPVIRISAQKWWLAISRGVLSRDLDRGRGTRPPVTCRRTPTFISPLNR